MKLYYSPGACSLSPHIVLKACGIDYQLIKVDLKTKKIETGEDFYKINPKGSVPVLTLDNGEILTEGPAIVQYIADLNPTSKLVPEAGKWERYRLQEWLNYISAEIHKTIGSLFKANLSEEAKQATIELLNKRFTFLESTLSKQPFLMGKDFSVADAYLFTVLRWNDLFKLNLDNWPSVIKYITTVRALPAVQAALKEEGIV